MDRRAPRLFWDSSALIATLMSASPDVPGRTVLRLGEAGLVDNRLSNDVLQDLEWAFDRRRRPDLRADLAMELDQAGFSVAPEPNQDSIAQCAELTGYWADARVLAAAEECGADILLTMDREHFIGNPLIGAPTAACQAMTPREVVAWLALRLGGDRG